jgi:hypothetical protein
LTSDIWTSYYSYSTDINYLRREKEQARMNAQDGKAMFELQLELHARAVGGTPIITADDLLEVHELLAVHDGDLTSLFGSKAPQAPKIAKV